MMSNAAKQSIDILKINELSYKKTSESIPE